MNNESNNNPNNHPGPPISERDQDNWEAEQRLRPKEDRLTQVAKEVVDAYDAGGGDRLETALQALGMLVR